MTLAARRDRILGLVRGTGYLAIEDLADRLEVTPQTIRRDLNELADAGHLVRHHGGASMPSSIGNTSYDSRRAEFPAQKAAIAKAVANLVPERSSIFLSLGTTTLAIAQALHLRRELKVVTNSLDAAQVLARRPDIEVIVLGGQLAARNLGVSGTTTALAVEQYRVDSCVFSVGGIDNDGNLLDYYETEVAVVRSMLRCARRSVLAVDHSKFGRTASVRLGSIADLTAVVTDKPLTGPIRRIVREAGVELITARVD